MATTSFKVVFTCKGCLAPFTEVVQADSVEHARALVKQMVADNGLKLKQITLVIQL